MARPPRIEFDGAWYHVMNRGARRWNVFHDSYDRQYFFKLLGNIRDLWNVECHAYSLMPNHFHLLIHTPNSHLSKSMRHVGAQYTIYYNKKYKKDGPLFRGRFKSILAEKDSYLLALIRYIHLNPVRAGLCNMPADHPWTSHQAYMNKKNRPKWLVVTDVLGEFGKTYKSAQKRLEEFVMSSQAPDLVKFIETKKRVSILGSQGFRDWVKYNFLDKVSRDKQIPTMRRKKRQHINHERIMKYVINEYQIKRSSILKNTGGVYNEPRSILMHLLRHINGMSHAEIAKYLSLNTATVSKNLQRFNGKLHQDKILNEKAITYVNNLLSHVQS